MPLQTSSIDLIVEVLIGWQFAKSILTAPLALGFAGVTYLIGDTSDWLINFLIKVGSVVILSMGMQTTSFLQATSNIILLVLTIFYSSGFDGTNIYNILLFGVLPTVLTFGDIFVKQIAYAISMASIIQGYGMFEIFYFQIPAALLAPFYNLIPVAITNAYFFNFPIVLFEMI